MGIVEAVCISEKKGTMKQPQEKIEVVEGYGISGDAHAGPGHRQVSLLAKESADKVREKIPGLKPGAFAENILTSGIDIPNLKPGMILKAGGALLKVTQIGKECHEDCEIRRLAGTCVMPTEGVFAIALSSAPLKKGDIIEILEEENGGEGINAD